jgi:hypothetical protein
MRKTTFLAFMVLATIALTGCRKNDADPRDIFVGTYSVTETWTENSKAMSKPAFAMSVEKAFQNSDMLLLNNFANYGAGTTADATVSDYLLTIPQQTLPNLKAIIGSGKSNGPTLTFTYTESYNSISIEITATALKK